MHHQRLKIGYMVVFELFKEMNGPDVTGGLHKNKIIIKGGLLIIAL